MSDFYGYGYGPNGSGNSSAFNTLYNYAKKYAAGAYRTVNGYANRLNSQYPIVTPGAANAAPAPQATMPGTTAIPQIAPPAPTPTYPFQPTMQAAPQQSAGAGVPQPPSNPAPGPNTDNMPNPDNSGGGYNGDYGWGNSDPFGLGIQAPPASKYGAGPPQARIQAAAAAGDPAYQNFYHGPGSMDFGAGDSPSGNTYGQNFNGGQDLVRKYMGFLMGNK